MHCHLFVLLIVHPFSFIHCYYVTLNHLTGPQKNKIVSILKDVPWEELDQQLNLNQISYIDGACQREKNPVPCKLREVLNRFINAQTAQSCCETVQKIASALENLPEPRKFEASKLREMCTYTGISMP